MARKPGKPPQPSKAAIKAAAARAEARSKGEEVVEPPAPITPPIVSAAAKAKRKRGRPAVYTPAIGKAICKMLAHGMTLRGIAKRENMPRASTIVGWAMDPNHPFSAHYMRARVVGYTLMVDDIVEIADDSGDDFSVKEVSDGVYAPVFNREHMDRVKVRIDTRKWIVARALPKFADKMSVEHTGKDGGPIETSERPQATGDDHMAELTKRFASRAAPANGKLNGSGLH